MVSYNLLKVDTLIDAFHAVHRDMRGNIGGFISCVVNTIRGNALKQNMNTKTPQNQK